MVLLLCENTSNSSNDVCGGGSCCLQHTAHLGVWRADTHDIAVCMVQAKCPHSQYISTKKVLCMRCRLRVASVWLQLANCKLPLKLDSFGKFCIIYIIYCIIIYTAAASESFETCAIPVHYLLSMSVNYYGVSVTIKTELTTLGCLHNIRCFH